MKRLDRVWKTLHERGYGWYSKHNTVLLDTVSHSASHPDNVCVVPRWSCLLYTSPSPRDS